MNDRLNAILNDENLNDNRKLARFAREYVRQATDGKFYLDTNAAWDVLKSLDSPTDITLEAVKAYVKPKKSQAKPGTLANAISTGTVERGPKAERTHLWKGKEVTERQFAHYVSMTKDGQVPENSGPIGTPVAQAVDTDKQAKLVDALKSLDADVLNALVAQLNA